MSENNNKEDNKKENLIESKSENKNSFKIKDSENKSSFLQNFAKIFLDIDYNKKTKIKINNDDINNKISNADIINDRYSKNEDFSVNDNDEMEIVKPNAIEVFKASINKLIHKTKMHNWDEYMKSYEKKIQEKISIKYKLKNVFNIKSDFMIIWKLTFSAFSIVFVFIYFLKYILIDLAEKEDKNEVESSKKILYVYYMINLMFFFELMFSILVIIFNGGSIITFLKLPLKIYTVIPFPLKKKNLFLLIPKFLRIDLFNKLFSIIEVFINSNIAHYVHNYYLKIFITYTCDMFKYLLLFGFYAHCLCSLLCYFYEPDGELKYIPSLYYTIQTFTTIGFGEMSPVNKNSLIIMIITLFLGINFFSLMTSNIRYLSNKIKDFNRETSFNEQFEFLIFQIQKSTGKVFPTMLKKLMSLFLLFRRGLAYYEIKSKNKRIFNICRDKIIKNIHKTLFNYLKEDFSVYFHNCEEEFIFEIFQRMKPKMLKADKTIVEYNTNIKGLYFLINGNIFIFDKYDNPVYAISDNNLFGEYEFLTNIKTNYKIKVHPKMAAYGFVLKKSDWEYIANKYILSAKNFIETIKLRNKKHNEWIIFSLKKYKNLNIEQNNKINEEINDKDIYGQQNDENKNKSNKDLIIAAKEKDEKYNIKNGRVFKEIEEILKELRNFEDDLSVFKNDILNNIKIKKF